MQAIRLNWKKYIFRKPHKLNPNSKGFWFMIGIKQSSLLNFDEVVKLIEETFYIKCQRQGIGTYKEKQADFFVKTQKKRNEIARFVARNIGCKFYKVK